MEASKLSFYVCFSNRYKLQSDSMAQQESVNGLPAYGDVAVMFYPDVSTATCDSPPPSYSSRTSRNVAAASPQQLNPKQLQEQQDHHHHHQQQQQQQQQQHRHRQLEPVSVITQA